MLNVNLAWDNYLKGINTNTNTNNSLIATDKINSDNIDGDNIDGSKKIFTNIPKCSDIYISTKTMIAHLSNIDMLDLLDMFWKLEVIPYHILTEGIVKKQIKFICNTEEEFNLLQLKIAENSDNCDQHVISRITNKLGKIKFRDIRKISIGLSKKDICSYRCKKKGAFYNCFAIILRINHNDTYKEIHVKVFNTGKLEIPGIQNKVIFNKTIQLLCNILNSINPINTVSPITNRIGWYIKDSSTVLINSNFSTGYYIDRHKLYNILKNKYLINTAYDPCSYPGIQSEFYYNLNTDIQSGRQPSNLDISGKLNYIKISFMIFRTGSVLIVGKCEENILNNIYIFLVNLLTREFKKIFIKYITNSKDISNKKRRKSRVIIRYISQKNN